MLRVGLTGGMATGKSFVAAELQRLGCDVLQADQVGHQLLEPGGAAVVAVVKAFGQQVLTADGGIDRPALAAIVFQDAARLSQLNGIVHPLVFQQEEAWMAQLAPRAIAVVEAAILMESGSYRRFQKIILTTCEEPVQIARAMARSGQTEAQVRARLARQWPLAQKRRFADHIIDTSGSPESTLAQTRAVFQKLRSLA